MYQNSYYFQKVKNDYNVLHLSFNYAIIVYNSVIAEFRSAIADRKFKNGVYHNGDKL